MITNIIDDVFSNLSDLQADRRQAGRRQAGA